MSVKTLLLTKKTDKQLEKLPLKIHIKITLALKYLKQNPIAGAKLGGELGDSYKYSLGDYRIIYKFNHKESKLEVLKIEHRQGVYK